MTKIQYSLDLGFRSISFPFSTATFSFFFPQGSLTQIKQNAFITQQHTNTSFREQQPHAHIPQTQAHIAQAQAHITNIKDTKTTPPNNERSPPLHCLKGIKEENRGADSLKRPNIINSAVFLHVRSPSSNRWDIGNLNSTLGSHPTVKEYNPTSTLAWRL